MNNNNNLDSFDLSIKSNPSDDSVGPNALIKKIKNKNTNLYGCMDPALNTDNL